ncbi:MAG: TauD/TfdA family dioxygenase [Alphaproteobacteria bacterium]|jgi:taurine dioxygenase|nr:TauD/TfdA family dioxygenase [Alphaproteobacteria bacterium]MDP6831504.1 TauD/TfdA family dioxygenase [Alphaproteobacteria bacterium]MDP6872934.1 TauD/TfdA family dioxygenase [Alphaproteobacteria bacterium]
MTLSNIRVKPVTASIGADVEGVDLAEPLSDATFDMLHDALMDHQVLFFRDQEMSLEQHKDLGRRFGDLHVHPAAPAPKDHPEILVIHADEKSKYVAGGGWHSDVSCDVEPPMGSILHIHTAPEIGGDTLFSSMYGAYESLSDKMQNFLDGLTALHRSEHVHKGRYGLKENLRDDGYPEAVHPVVRTHPVTGRKGLFVNASFTTRILELSHHESNDMLQMLFNHVARGVHFQCRYRWENNSVAFWDNRCTQHHAAWDYYPNVRHGYRVTIQGDRPA